jgi:hypothetical protein
MPDALNNMAQEYWKPARTTNMTVTATEVACPNCGTDYTIGARFCHVCGNERDPQVGIARTNSFARFFDFHRIKEALGLPTASLIAFVIGVACIVGALMTGVIYTAATVLDWQAVQLWRIEWLLAAVAAFLAGILLKRTEHQ